MSLTKILATKLNLDFSTTVISDNNYSCTVMQQLSVGMYLSEGYAQVWMSWRSCLVAEYASPAFKEFLSCIGTKIVLKDFDQYRGGLDCKSKL